MAQEGRGRRADAAVAPRLSPALPEDQSFSSSGRIVARFSLPDGDGGYDEWLNTIRPPANGANGHGAASTAGANGHSRARLYSLPGDTSFRPDRPPADRPARGSASPPGGIASPAGAPSGADESDSRDYTGRRRKFDGGAGRSSDEYTGRRRKFDAGQSSGSFSSRSSSDEYTGRRRKLDMGESGGSFSSGSSSDSSDEYTGRRRKLDLDSSGSWSPDPSGTVYQSRTSHYGRHPAVGRSRYVAPPDPHGAAPVARGVYRIPVSEPEPKSPPAVGVVQTGQQPALPPAMGVVHTGSQPAFRPDALAGSPADLSGQQQALVGPPAVSAPPTAPPPMAPPAMEPQGFQPPAEEQIPGRDGRVLVVQRFGQPSGGQGAVEAERPAVYRTERGGSPVGFGGPPNRDRTGSTSRPESPVPTWRPAGRYAGVHRGQPAGRPLPFWQELPLLMLVAFSLAVLVNTFLLQAFTIPSGSMENTLRVGDKVVTEKVSLDFRPPKRGEIVVFKASGAFQPEIDIPDRGPVASFFSELARALGFPTADEKDIIKRVVGLPGDEVECCDDDGRVLVNGEPLDEPYILDNDAPNERDFGPVTVPPGRLFVMGDHRAVSEDSRKLIDEDPKFKGTVPIDSIIGRAVFIVYPPDHWTGLGDPDLFATVPQPAQALPDSERGPPVSTTVAIGVPFLPLLLLPRLRRHGRHRLLRLPRRAST